MATRMSGGGAIWLTAALGLSGLIAFELTDESPLTPAVIAASSDATMAARAPAEPPAAVLPSADLIDRIIDRPLFSASRRPALAALEEVEAPLAMPEQALELELIGTMLKDGAPIALLRHPHDGLVRLRRGQEVGGWTITAIGEAGVSIDNGERSDMLTLRKDLSRPSAPGAVRKKSGLVKAEQPAGADEPRETADRR
ncbi:MAG: hypothetical protein R3F54_08630 [Alphaproteobacteria bacterium]